MMRKLLLSFLFAIPLAFVACTAEKPAPQPEPQGEQKPDAAPAALVISEPTVHDVMCGCSIDGVGHCGNFIKLEGKYVPVLHASLGRMEWCKHKDKGAKVETTGELKDGKFIAKQIKTLE